MKVKVTRKYINGTFDNVFSVGYCGASSLLYDVTPFAYNAGVNGWNCDYYNLGGVIICTGYRPHGKMKTDVTNKYEILAGEIRYNYNLDYDVKCAEIAKIREKWIDELLTK